MGSCISQIDDDNDAYEMLCIKVGVEPIYSYTSKMHQHEKELMDKYGYERTYFGYQKKQKEKLKDKK